MRNEKILTWLTLIIGLGAFIILLAYYRIVDGDLWARLAAGAAVFHQHGVLKHDIFAFTPVLPVWVDHEWGAGVVFFALLKWFGPESLMIFKSGAAVVALMACLAAARLNGARPAAILMVAIPCAVTILPAFANVVRSHSFTFPLFGLLLLGLELIRNGRRWPAFVIVPMMLFWVNVHGGFVVGLGAIMVYAVLVPKARMTLLATLLGCVLVTCLNPYGISFWKYLIPALLHPRPDISEWAPMPLWGEWRSDPYIGFRFLFVIALVLVIARRKNGSLPGLVMLALMALFAFRSRRHAPFFGLAAAVFLPPYLDGLLSLKIRWEFPVLAVYGVLAAFVFIKFLPTASLEPLVPEHYYPVRPADILTEAKVRGNLAVPFRWGSYALWRLYPGIRVSIDGRYEETYPDATFQMNHDFFYKDGPQWDRLAREHHVDYVMIEIQAARVTLADLHERSFDLIWLDRTSALLARHELAPALKAAASRLTDQTVEPLDARIPDAWWR